MKANGDIFCTLNLSMRLRQQIFRIVNEDSGNYRPSRLFNGAIILLIILNVVAIIMESDDYFAVRYKVVFDQIEFWSVLIFGFEYILRLGTADFIYPDKKGWKAFLTYLVSPLAIVDLLAILPSIIIIIAPYTIYLVGALDFRMIRLLRTLRLFRVFKISRYSSSLRMIITVFREKGRELGVTIFITFILMVLSSTLMFTVEHDAQEDQFPNILATFWWAVATLTTVGYGDVYPITGAGKVLGGVIALLGIGLVALPTGILSSAFVDKMERNKQREEAIAGESFKGEAGQVIPKTPYCAHCGKELGPDGKPLDDQCGRESIS